MVPPKGFDKILNEQVKVSGTVLECEEESSGGSSIILSGEATAVSDPSINMKGKISIRSWDYVFPYVYGDIVEIDGRLTQPKPARNPGAFDYRKYLEHKGIFSTITIYDKSDILKIGRGGNSFLRWVRDFRNKIEWIMDETIPRERPEILNDIPVDWKLYDTNISKPSSASVLKGIILGARAALPEEIYRKFVRTGTSHVLAVSGLHVGILAGWTYLIFRLIMKRLGISNKAFAYIPTIPVIIVYACMIGFYSSIVRASILLIFVVVAVIIDRDTDLFNILAIAALFILSYLPGSIWDVGFQLSFGSVASIAYLMPLCENLFGLSIGDKSDRQLRKVIDIPKKERTNWLKGSEWYQRLLYRIAQTIAVSWSAQVGASLIIAYTFHKVSLVAPIANPVVVPLVSLIIPLGFISCIAGLIYQPAASFIGYMNHYSILYIMDLAESFFSGIWWALITISGFSFWSLVSCSTVIVFIVNIPRLLKRKQRLIIVGAATTAILIWSIALSYEGHLLKVTYLDVGQGDSIFVELPDGRNILIDGGPYRSEFDTGKRVIVPFLQHKGINRLNLVVATHPHNDHTGGLTYTVENVPVGEVITGSYNLTTPSFDILKQRLDREGIEYKDAEVGRIYKDASLCIETIMCNAGNLMGISNQDVCMDNNSIVLKITYKKVSFLFPGDIRWDSERQLVNLGKDIRTTVLKVPHHGSGNSSSWEFLKAVKPTIGVISVGQNFFGHPSKSVLDKYDERHIKTYRTDKDGAVTILTDGKQGWISTMY